MRITVKRRLGQLMLLIFITVVCACVKKEETIVIPPLTSPLSMDYIGYGVITESFTHIYSEPQENSSSLGYLRRGSLVNITKRQTIRAGNWFETWVQLEGYENGWLKEEVMVIYESENQAKTASESILK